MTVLKVIVLKSIVKLLNLIRPGGGTALPGLLALKYAPELFEQFASQLEQVVLITGTNGKTTTRNLLSVIFDEGSIKHFSNKEGSNMKRGLMSTFLKETDFWGKMKTKNAILEVEEATLPQIIENLRPKMLIVTNLFRDQLDAYGEVNKTQEYIRDAISKTNNCKLILNADDPLVRELAESTSKENVIFYSIEKSSRDKFNYEGDESELGPIKEAIVAKDIKINAELHTKFQINLINYELRIPGIFHVYNSMAAILAAREFGLSQKVIQDAFAGFEPAFGRGEQLGRYKILLIKNPAGFSLTLDMLKNVKNPNILLILNDRIADGRDVSWIWDAEVEKLAEVGPKRIFVSGTRAEDMSLRIKYAFGFDTFKDQDGYMQQDLKKIVKEIDFRCNDDEIIYVLPTYTAMNEFRKVLGRKF